MLPRRARALANQQRRLVRFESASGGPAHSGSAVLFTDAGVAPPAMAPLPPSGPARETPAAWLGREDMACDTATATASKSSQRVRAPEPLHHLTGRERRDGERGPTAQSAKALLVAARRAAGARLATHGRSYREAITSPTVHRLRSRWRNAEASTTALTP